MSAVPLSSLYVVPKQLTTTARNLIPSPIPKQIIFNTTTGQFEGYDGSSWQQFATEPAGGFTATSVPFASDTGELIDDVTNFSYDLTNHRPVFNPPRILGMTQGSVLFVGASGLVSQDNSNYFWDATNHRLGVKTTTPMGAIAVASPSTGGILPAGWTGLWSVFGPNAGSANGAALGVGYDSTGDRSVILSIAPSVAWKPLHFSASAFAFFGEGGAVGARVVNYNTFTDPANYELAYMGDWGVSANVATYGTGKAGTGSSRSVQFVVGGATFVTLDQATGNIISTGRIVIPGANPMLTSSSALPDGAASATGTLTNAPTAGNPTKWVPINDNGTTRYIPAW